MTDHHSTVWSLPTVWQKGGECIMNRIHSNNKGVSYIHKNSCIEMMEHLSETASSSSDIDTTTLRGKDHPEYDSLLCDAFGSQHQTVDDRSNNHKDETTLVVVPSWNTIQTKLIDQVTQRFTPPPVSSTTSMTNRSRFIDENMTTYDAAYNDDDDDYDSDNDAIRVLYYHHPPSPPTVLDDSPHHVASSIVSNHDDGQLMTHLVTMMEQYDLYHNMYKTDQIYDVRIYESVLIVLLLSNQSHRNNTDNNVIDYLDQTTSTTAIDSYDEALHTVATFLVDPSIPCRSKLNVLQLLLVHTCRDHQPPYDETGDEPIPDEIVRDMYAFCISLYFGVNDIECTIHRCFSSPSDDDDDDDQSYNNVSTTMSNADNFSNTATITRTITATTGSTGSNQQLLCPMIWELRSKCLYLQEMYTIYDELSLIRQEPTQRSAVWSPLASPYDAYWESIKNYCYNHDSILIQDIDLLKAFYNILGRHKSMQYSMLIASIGYLRMHCMYHQEGVTMHNYFKYSEALQNVVLFISNWTISDSWKMAVLYCLQYSIDDTVRTSTKNDASTILSLNTFQQKKTSDDSMYYAKVLSFCTCDDAYTDSFLVQSPQPGIDRNKNSHTSSSLCAFYLLLWELRVLTCHHKQQRKERQQKLVQLLQHRILQFRSFLSKSASKIGSNSGSSIIRTKQVMAQQLPVTANVMKTKMNQVRITIQTHVQICHHSFTQKSYRDK